ncbi:MAG: IS1634 family transposase [Actinobacteria bacterium]|nr:MAG: IS1634 family transposase [Actinomycetota bacterium]
MTALVKKIKEGRAYWYATESARVNGQPRVVRQRYLGTVESIEAAFDAAYEPEAIDVVEFGATATMWALAGRINFGLCVDAALGPQGTGLSVGTYLQAAAVNRAVKPKSKRGFSSWYEQSVLHRILPAPPQAWASQRFWDAMARVDASLVERIEETYVKAAVAEFGVDAEALVYDATNFHTYISSTNDKAPIAQRGHAKNKRFDLRLVGLALACSTDHRIPLAHIATVGNDPDSKVFTETLPKLVARLEAVGVDPASVTVVFDKGNNSKANLARVDAARIGFVGSLVPTQHRDLLAVLDEEFQAVEDLPGVVAYRCQKEIYGVARTIVVTRSETFLAKQLVGLAQTRARVEVALAELDRLLAGGRHKMDRQKLQARVNDALSPRWMSRLYRTEITGTTKDDVALSWSFDEEAFAQLKARELGKRIVFTDRKAWSTREIVVAYRSQWEAEAAFRQMKNHEHAAFRPIHHWTEQKIRVHALYGVASLMLVNLAWREADRAGMGLSPNEVMEALAAIQEVTLIYPPAKGKGRPRILKKLTRMDSTQQELFELFGLEAFAPREGTTAKWRGF